MSELNPKRLGITFGLLALIAHFLWALVVASGSGQWLVNWILGLHFVSMPITIVAFDVVTTLGLLIVATMGGFIFGYVLAFVWNWSKKYK